MLHFVLYSAALNSCKEYGTLFRNKTQEEVGSYYKRLVDSPEWVFVFQIQESGYASSKSQNIDHYGLQVVASIGYRRFNKEKKIYE